MRLLIVCFFLVLIADLNSQTWQWAKMAVGDSEGHGIATDNNGNVYSTGNFAAGKLSFGADTLFNNNSNSMYLVKYSATGNVLWARMGIGTITDYGTAISCDNVGNVYVSGIFTGSTICFGTYTLTNNGGGNVFLVKYDENGNVLWARRSDGISVWYYFNSISVDNSGNICVAGTFKSPTAVFGSYTLTNNGIQNMFLVKYDQNGNALWARQANGNNSMLCQANSVCTSTDGDIYVTGFIGAGYTTFGSYTLTSPGGENMFLAKYDSGGSLVWAKCSQGTSQTFGNSVTIDDAGNIYTSGYFTSPSTVFDSYTLTNGGSSNLFISRYDNAGNVLWAKTANGNAQGYCLAPYSNGIFLSGTCADTLSLDSYTLIAPSGATDAMFIAGYSFSGTVNYASILASGGQVRNGIFADKSCNAFVTGDFKDAASPFTIGTNIFTGSYFLNHFVAKLSYTCTSGISEAALNNEDIKIYPNPAKENLKILGEEGDQLKVFNAIGQIMFERKLLSGTNDIDVGNLSSGLYYFIITDKETVRKKEKIIVK